MSEITSLGTLLINSSLPEEMRKQQWNLDKKSVHQLFTTLAEKYPDRYKEVLNELSEIGRTAVWTEGASVSLASLLPSKKKEEILSGVRERVQAIIDNDDLSPEKRKKAIVDTLLPVYSQLSDAIYEEAREEGSPYVPQIESGARGKKSDLSSLRGADLLATDQKGDFIPVPLFNSYAEGFTPAQYFAAAYGQRKGALDVKMATADAGFYTKQLVNAAHRQVITKDVPDPTRLPVGLPTDVDDGDNIGAILAHKVGTYEPGTLITSEIIEDLKDQGVKDLLIHSPMTEITADGGISRWSAGRRAGAGLPLVGENVGIAAAQAIGERLSQGSLSSKHSAGVSSRINRAGFEYVNRLTQAPEHFPEAAPLVEEDGTVEDISDAPQGGKYVTVGKQKYYIPDGIEVTVAIGQQVEPGDDLSDGVPHPRDLIRLRGIGEARRTFLKYFKEGLENSGIPTHRRNAESVVAGLINWARVTNPDGYGENIYDDIVPFNALASAYKPRAGAQERSVSNSVGQYLEEPALHYTPGTRITRKVAKEMDKWGIKKAFLHSDPPDFEPEGVRGIQSVYHDPDWQTRLLGFYTASAFEKSLHRGAESDTQSTSFVPSLANPSKFGKNLQGLGKYGEAR